MGPFFSQNQGASVVFSLAFAAWAVPELAGSLFQNARAGSLRQDRGSYLFLILIMSAGVIGGFWLAFHLPAWRLSGDPAGWFAPGILLMLLGTAFRWYAIHLLGKYFTRAVAIHPGQHVVQAGPYRWIRHPSYTGTLVTLCGLGLATGSWASLAVILGSGLAGLLYRVSVEERALRQALGQPYLDYMRHTRMFIPFLW